MQGRAAVGRRGITQLSRRGKRLSSERRGAPRRGPQRGPLGHVGTDFGSGLHGQGPTTAIFWCRPAPKRAAMLPMTGLGDKG